VIVLTLVVLCVAVLFLLSRVAKLERSPDGGLVDRVNEYTRR
jgi:hypothetical protein